MAERTPAQEIDELRDLIVGYAKQEAVDPLKNLGRWVGYGVAGALLIGAGVVCAGVALLRFLQTSGPEWADGSGHSVWVGYLVQIIFYALVIVIAWFVRGRPEDEAKRTP